jgi:drug/metabolite transporter superfamily protein YnfA
MKKRLTHINPVHTGKVLAALGGLYSLFGLLFFAMVIGIGMVTGNYHLGSTVGPDAFVMLLVPPIIGCIYGVVGAVVYNSIAKWTGGIEFTISDVAPREVPPWPAALPRYPFAPR